MFTHLVLVVIQAFALPVARFLANIWICSYTASTPKEERDDRRAEVLSDIHEHIRDSQAQGYRPAEIAAQVMFRTAWGFKDDLAWSVPYLPSALVNRLEGGSKALRRFKTPNAAITLLAFFSMINLGYFFLEADRSWMELLGMNIVAIGVTTVMHNEQRSWARRIIHGYLGIATAAFIGSLLWVVLHYRLYEDPDFPPFMLQAAAAILPVALAILVSTKTCRVRVFKGLWWPVFACWGLILGISVGTAIQLGLSFVLTSWATMALIPLVLGVTAVIFIIGAAIVCYGGVKGGAGCMHLMAAGIRRLT